MCVCIRVCVKEVSIFFVNTSLSCYRTMLHYWLLLSWFGSASLQFIDVGPAPEPVLDPLGTSGNIPMPYVNYINLPPQGELSYHNDALSNTDNYNQFYQRDDLQPNERKRRMTEEEQRNWLPNLLDSDKTLYARNEEKTKSSPFIIEAFSGAVVEDNATDVLKPVKKRSFSPWGGKRSDDSENIEQMWSWKRAAVREPSMPKRVRFSPWGGKRSGQMIYKPGNKASRVIYSTSIPELTRIVSNYSPTGERFDIAGFRFRPTLDKRHPVKILALAQAAHIRDALPFKRFMDPLPSMFKPGHPYLDVNLNKDGKRKVKFSAWGGKRSPPIIGPIWTPAPQNIKESSLDAILLIRTTDNKDELPTKAL